MALIHRIKLHIEPKYLCKYLIINTDKQNYDARVCNDLNINRSNAKKKFIILHFYLFLVNYYIYLNKL